MTDEYRYRVSMKCDTHGNIHGYPYCPECTIASLRAQLARVDDVEGMAKVLAGGCFDLMGERAISGYRADARAVSAWLKEGKG